MKPFYISLQTLRQGLSWDKIELMIQANIGAAETLTVGKKIKSLVNALM